MALPGWLRHRRVRVFLAGLAIAATASFAVAAPHPAVVRVSAPEQGAISYGSGTLVDVRDQFGLVITNWHVVRDATGDIEVQFPDGFRSKARALKVDEDWDLAALVVWRPPVAPVTVTTRPPQPGDVLTICGYGQGEYRAATGRCTKYYAPKENFPEHMVELDVQARQGDSGGPIFNDRGELAGVLFGAGSGTTLGSFGGRVSDFLSTLVPDIGQGAGAPLVAAGSDFSPAGILHGPVAVDGAESPGTTPANFTSASPRPSVSPVTAASPNDAAASSAGWTAAPRQLAAASASGAAPTRIFDQLKNVLAAVGVAAILAATMKLVK